MQKADRSNLPLVILAILAGVLTALALRSRGTIPTIPPVHLPVGDSALRPAAAVDVTTENMIRFYRDRVRRDPEETRSQNALAELYLQRVRETGNEDFLLPALAAAKDSLGTVEYQQNLGGLTALAHAEFANHDFAAARDHALQLIELRPDQADFYAMLGDACLELGEYPRALEAYEKMRQRGERNSASEIRQARLAVLSGDLGGAKKYLENALIFFRDLSEPPRETIAWCQWQTGEIAFANGEYEAAEKCQRAALVTVPNDFRALGSLGRIYAARGQVEEAIRYLAETVRIAPSVDLMSALGDLYQLAGRTDEARARYELVAQIGEHTQKIHGTPFDRALANFYANHDLKSEEAYALAAGEYAAGRRDIYGADALAWTALNANRLPEAQAAMKEALKLGTVDARLFYHAGMIARATGDGASAKEYLQRALTLNPGFDPLQSQVARHILAGKSP